MDVRKRFEAWLQWHGWSRRDLAERLNADNSTFARLIDEPDREPRLGLAFQIDALSRVPRESDGQVWPGAPLLASEWVSEKRLRAKAAKLRAKRKTKAARRKAAA